MQILEKTLLFLGALVPIISGSPAPVNDDLKGKYIVTVKEGIDVASHTAWVTQVHKRNVAKRDDGSFGVTTTYRTFPAYAGHFDDATIQEIKASPDVVSVEKDQIWSIWSNTRISDKPATEDDQISHIFDAARKLKGRQSPFCRANAGYALGALSHRSCNSNEYCYFTPAAGKYAYVIDTGVNIAHQAFGGRASNGYNAVGGAFTDGNGHGTHVAGIICSTYGVTPCNVIAVKVLGDNGSGSTANILNGYDWAINDIINKGRLAGAVINLSIGGGYSNAFNTAVANAYNRGVLSVCAAGGSAADNSNTSPSSTPQALSVGSHTNTCQRSSFSNYGPTVDIFAGGQNILSTWIGSTTATNTLSGTSMSAGIVSGLALYLQGLENLPNAAATTARILELSIKDQIPNPGPNTPNRRAYNGSGL